MSIKLLVLWGSENKQSMEELPCRDWTNSQKPPGGQAKRSQLMEPAAGVKRELFNVLKLSGGTKLNHLLSR